MDRINEAISWYQRKIGGHDKRSWERRFEGEGERTPYVLMRDATFKGQMIDIDLIKGSTFTKAKPELTWMMRTWRGIMRVLLLPFFWRWWAQHTSYGFLAVALILYTMQAVTLYTYVYYDGAFSESSESYVTSTFEIVAPLFYATALSVLHTHIVQTQSGSRRLRGPQLRGSHRRVRRTRTKTSSGRQAPSTVTPASGISSPANFLRAKAALTFGGVANALRPGRWGGAWCNSEDTADSGSSRTKNGQSAEEGGGSSGRTFRRRRRSSRGSPGSRSSSFDQNRVSSKGSSDRLESLARKPELNVRLEELTPTKVTSPQAFPFQDGFGNGSSTGGRMQEEATTDDAGLERLTTSTANDESEASDAELSSGAVFKPRSNSSDIDWESDQMQCSEINSSDTSSSYSDSQYEDDYEQNEEDDDDDPATLGSPHSAALPMTYFPLKTDKITCFMWEGRVCKKADLSVLGIGAAIEQKVLAASSHCRSDYVALAVCLTVMIALAPFVYRAHSSEHLMPLLKLPWQHGAEGVSDSKAVKVPSSHPSSPYFRNSLVDSTIVPIPFNGEVDAEDMGNNSSYSYAYSAIRFLQSTFIIGFPCSHILDEATVTSCRAVFEALRPLLHDIFGSRLLTWFASSNAFAQRACLSGLLFFFLAAAERTFVERLLYAKHFSYLTSARRSKKHGVPHFRLYKVKNIKAWLSLRSYLKKRGPQRSVDVIVTSTFILLVVTLSLTCVQLLAEHATFFNAFSNWELTLVCFGLGVFLLRLSALGNETNKKYRNLSILLTEQMNLYLQMEQRPHKKEDLLLANSVLRLAEDLLKELDKPFKVARVSLNPVVLNLVKVMMLSAFSAIFSELLGFKLKLYKVKIGG